MLCKPMARGFGATVEDIDLSVELSPGQVEQLLRSLYKHRFLVIPGQQLDETSYPAFARRLGKPITFFDPAQRDSEHPELIVIANSADTIEENRDFALHWHADGSYEDPPASITVLYGVEAPAVGSETRFCDMVAAYAALDDEMKARLEDVVVIHGKGRKELMLEGEYRGRADVPSLPQVYHRLAQNHPVTGEKLLYAPAGSPSGIVGMDEEEALDLLLKVKIHATQDRFTAEGAARTGGVLIWDNFAVLHAATPTRYSDRDGERRRIYRISTREIPQLSMAVDA
jgi:alpha-ketoglutarate-dependent taurine dioxygenase